MNHKDENTKLTPQAESLETLEPELREALGNFKASVNSWSSAMISRPREVQAPSGTNWSAVTKWALACVVFVTTLSGGVYQNHRQQEAAKAEAARVAEQQQREMAATQLAKENEQDLMANVDSDVAREVPSALEPLASLMTEDDSQGN
ncbi:MAG: hypothetical protein WB561_11910 [Terracidiphilus sp.]